MFIFTFQSLIKLLNVLSSFHAVYELLGDKTLPKKESYGFREIPDSVVVMFYYIIEHL